MKSFECLIARRTIWKALVVLIVLVAPAVQGDVCYHGNLPVYLVRDIGNGSNDIWTTGYMGGFYNAQICGLKGLSVSMGIKWKLGNDNDEYQDVVEVLVWLYTGWDDECRVYPETGYSGHCSFSTGGCLSTTITLESRLPQRLNNSKLGLFVDENECTTRRLTVKGCEIKLPLAARITSGTGGYTSRGELYCANNNSMYHSNGEKITENPQLYCSDSGEWTGADDVHCAEVPTVSVGGNLYVEDSKPLTVSCVYNPKIPPATRQTFYVGGIEYEVSEGNNFTNTYFYHQNGDEIYCVIETEYTASVGQKAVSPTKTITVFFKPRREREDPIVCDWTVGTANECDIIFFSNPTASYLSLKKGNTTIVQENRLYTVTRSPQVFQFYKENVVQSDAGAYRLTVKSSYFRQQLLIIDFTIKIRDNEENGNTGSESEQFPASETSSTTTGLIVVSLLAALEMVLLLFSFKNIRERNLRESALKGQESTTQPPRHAPSRDISIKPTPDVKEEKVNPLYHSFDEEEDEVFQVKDVKLVKEEANNPLYGATQQDQHSTSINDTAGTKNCKEVTENPLYGATDNDDLSKINCITSDEERINPLYGDHNTGQAVGGTH